MWYNKNLLEIEQELQTNINQGLTTKQIKERIKKNGKNELLNAKKLLWYKIFLLTFLEPLSLILIISGIISIIIEHFLNKNIYWLDLCIIFIIILVNAIIQTIEQLKTCKSIDSFKKITINTAIVKRNNNIMEISANELVIGDIVFLNAGKYIPADIRIIISNNLQIDESNLTGESIPVIKNNKIIKNQNIILTEQYNMAFMSTFVTNGKGIGIVVTTAIESEIGKISKHILNIKNKKTTLQIKLLQLTKIITIFAIILAILVLFIFYIKDNNNWLSNIMTITTIAIAIIPESLMIIVSIILTFSIKKMAKIKVIIKQLDVIETLGMLNVICCDKTGTLTKNKMIVKKIWINNQIWTKKQFKQKNNNKNFFFHFTNCLMLCNDVLFYKNKKIGDPTEIALIEYIKKYSQYFNWKNILNKKYKRIVEIPFDSNRQIMSTINQINLKKYVYTKGSVEKILKISTQIYLNNKIIPLTQQIKQKINEKHIILSNQSFRIISLAYKVYKEKETIEKKLIFLGLVALIDPLRKEANIMIQQAHKAGIRVIMITGDYQTTAFSIAKKLNIAYTQKEMITGTEINQLSDIELQKKLIFVNIFARATPEHKTRIINNLQKLNFTVAMIGDGINDAPSLSQANIGIAMGINSTDIAKNSANIILQNNNFLNIIDGIIEGRNIFQKIKKIIIFNISTNIAQILSFLIILIIFGIKPFNSINILWFNLIIETILSIPIGFDNNDNNLIFDYSYHKNISFFYKNWITIFFIAIITCICVVTTFCICYYITPDKYIQLYTKASTILVMSCSPAIYVYIIRLLSNFKSKNKPQKMLINWYLIISIMIVLILNFIIIFTPIIRDIFLLIKIKNNKNIIPYNIMSLSWIMIIISIIMMCIPAILLLCYKIIRTWINK